LLINKFTMKFLFVIGLFAISVVQAQHKGTQTQEAHPPVTIQKCSKSNGCQQEQGSATIDSNWRWLHKVGDYTNCYTGNKWDPSLCPDVETCDKNCALEGADSNTYSGTYGVKQAENGVQLGFVTHGPYSVNIGSRLFYMDTSSTYKLFKLLGQEFTFDVDVSNLDCGLNGALYFVSMDADGGMSEYSGNECGADLGTGYCDAQCPHDMKWISGEANVKDWKPSSSDPNAGTGHYGTCCDEMDIWESNKNAQAYTPHVCKHDGPKRCEGTECGDIETHDRYKGTCDKDGCDLNPYRGKNTSFFGPGSNFVVDSTKPMTVVTQFITDDGTTNGNLKEIKRLYVQNGKVIQNAYVSIPGKSYNSLTDETCAAQKDYYGEINAFSERGGMAKMGRSLSKGMVLVMSLWDDHYAKMLWLDSAYPLDKPATDPGITRGPCAITTGVPSDVEKNQANAYVKYYNIKYGDIGSTYQS